RRVWRKIHIGIDEQTLKNPCCRFHHQRRLQRANSDGTFRLDPPDQQIASVTANGAFDTRKCYDAIAARGAAAIIPPRKSAKPWKPDTPRAIARNEAPRASRPVGRTIWQRWSGYHRRSRVETKMHGVKLLGQRLSVRGFHRQVAKF
ncbi:IS5/IS1182 family transposase, partial [Staphylococcus pseudintermedius]